MTGATMEETEIGEVGVDKLAEQAHEKAREQGARVPWLRGLALSTALFAVAAAIASLEAGRYASEALLRMNEATLKQAQAADAWAYYQAKGVKQVTRDAEATILTTLNAPPDLVNAIRSDAQRYNDEQEQAKRQATQLEEEQRERERTSRVSLERHHTFAYAVTILQVAIGLSAIAALIERRAIWIIACVCGTAGMSLVVAGLF